MRAISARAAALVGPSGTVFLLIFVAPFAYFFVVSFWRVQAYKLYPAATLDNYARVVAEYWGPLLFSLGIAFAVTLLTTLLAFAFAYGIRFKAGRWGNALLFVALVTLFGGYLSKIYAWKTILGSAGVLNSALMILGITEQPITVFLYNPVAVVLTLLHYMIPLAILPLYGALRQVDDVPLRAATDLGASRWRVLRDIVLPQCQSGVIVAVTLTFLFAVGDYATPRLVGGPYTSMIGTFIQFQFGLRFDAPLGSAMAFTVIAISVTIVGMAAFAIVRFLRAPQ
jgi:spermidine/putrescine transport system permease protein